MTFLVFQLQAQLAAWGEPAVGEYRGSADHPSESALLGLIGAARGIHREDDASHAALCTGYGFAVGMQSSGKLLRDYHTAQVPGRVALKGRPHATRSDELTMPRHELHTVLSTRDYRQDGSWLVAVQMFEGAPYTLDELAGALRHPRFVLYLGRKSCPPAAPLFPQVVNASSAYQAFIVYRAQLQERRAACKDRWNRSPLEESAPIARIAWGDGVDSGVKADLSVTRKDRIIRRKGWQFGDRAEHIAVVTEAS